MDENKEPLKQEVEYDFEEHLIYGRQKKWKKIIEGIITIFGWIVILSFVIYYIYGNMTLKRGKIPFEFFYLNRRMLREINKYCFIAFIAFLILVILLILWKNYNYYRFGRLKRRKFKAAVDNKEVAEMFEIDEAFVTKMQSERYVLLENNIIPEDLGIGNKDKKKEKEKEKEKEKLKQ